MNPNKKEHNMKHRIMAALIALLAVFSLSTSLAYAEEPGTGPGQDSSIITDPATDSGLIEKPIDEYGGVGNFYRASSCYISGGATARLTNYDINYWTDQRYHHSMTSSSGYLPNTILYDNKKWPRSDFYAFGASGTKSDGYQSFRNMFTRHTVQFIWFNSITGSARSCTLTL